MGPTIQNLKIAHKCTFTTWWAKKRQNVVKNPTKFKSSKNVFASAKPLSHECSQCSDDVSLC